MLCKDSCDRCTDDHMRTRISDAGLPFTLPGYYNLTQDVLRKQHAAFTSPKYERARQKVLFRVRLRTAHCNEVHVAHQCHNHSVRRTAACLQIARLNQQRLSVAQLDPSRCQVSTDHAAGSALTHAFDALLTSRGTRGAGEALQTSIQNTCRFELLAQKEAAAEECFDARKDGSCAAASACFGAEFESMQHGCAQSCGFCGVCADDHAKCAAWAAQGQCRTNPSYMETHCAESCGFCGHMYDPQPPHWVALWTGALMPVVGLGTAGLGAETLQAVQTALRVGYRAIDTAQAPEWYREEAVGKVRLRLGAASALLLHSEGLHKRPHAHVAHGVVRSLSPRLTITLKWRLARVWHDVSTLRVLPSSDAN